MHFKEILLASGEMGGGNHRRKPRERALVGGAGGSQQGMKAAGLGRGGGNEGQGANGAPLSCFSYWTLGSLRELRGSFTFASNPGPGTQQVLRKAQECTQ